MEKKHSGDLGKKIAYYALIGVFGLVFLCSALYIGNYLLKSGEANNAYENLEQMRPTRPVATQPKPPATDPSTGETQWMQKSYLDPQQPYTPTLPLTPTPPSEANVQGFLDQARRQEQAMRGNDNDNENENDNDNEDIFDNNQDNEPPF